MRIVPYGDWCSGSDGLGVFGVCKQEYCFILGDPVDESQGHDVGLRAPRPPGHLRQVQFPVQQRPPSWENEKGQAVACPWWFGLWSGLGSVELASRRAGDSEVEGRVVAGPPLMLASRRAGDSEVEGRVVAGPPLMFLRWKPGAGAAPQPRPQAFCGPLCASCCISGTWWNGSVPPGVRNAGFSG